VPGKVKDFGGVAVQISDGCVDLCEGDPHANSIVSAGLELPASAAHL
jgi:hypothetical protein